MRIPGPVISVVLMLAISTGGCMQPMNDRSRATFQNNTGPIFCLVYSPDGKHLALGTGGFDARIWEATTGRELAVLEGHTNGISSVAFSPTGNTLAVGSWDKTVSIWSIAAEIVRKGTIECDGQVTKVVFSPDGKFLVVAEARTVKVWDLTGENPKEQTVFKTGAQSMALVSDAQMLLTVSEDGAVRIWHIKTGLIQATIQEAGSGAFAIVAYDGGKMLALADSSAITLLEHNAGKTSKKNSIKEITTCLSISPDGKVLAAGVLDKTIKFWDSSNGRELATLAGHTGRINAIAYSPDGKMLVSASDDKTVRLWNVTNP